MTVLRTNKGVTSRRGFRRASRKFKKRQRLYARLGTLLLQSAESTGADQRQVDVGMRRLVHEFPEGPQRMTARFMVTAVTQGVGPARNYLGGRVSKYAQGNPSPRLNMLMELGRRLGENFSGEEIELEALDALANPRQLPTPKELGGVLDFLNEVALRRDLRQGGRSVTVGKAGTFGFRRVQEYGFRRYDGERDASKFLLETNHRLRSLGADERFIPNWQKRGVYGLRIKPSLTSARYDHGVRPERSVFPGREVPDQKTYLMYGNVASGGQEILTALNARPGEAGLSVINYSALARRLKGLLSVPSQVAIPIELGRISQHHPYIRFLRALRTQLRSVFEKDADFERRFIHFIERSERLKHQFFGELPPAIKGLRQVLEVQQLAITPGLHAMARLMVDLDLLQDAFAGRDVELAAFAMFWRSFTGKKDLSRPESDLYKSKTESTLLTDRLSFFAMFPFLSALVPGATDFQFNERLAPAQMQVYALKKAVAEAISNAEEEILENRGFPGFTPVNFRLHQRIANLLGFEGDNAKAFQGFVERQISPLWS